MLPQTIFDVSRFPASIRLNASVDGTTMACDFTDGEGRTTNFLAVKSFWWRRPQTLLPDPRIVDPAAQHFALNESLSALYGVLRCCPGLWVNDIDRDQNADFKPRQLALARSHGLQVPETLITNNPTAVRAFYERHGGQVVFKAFNQRNLIWQPTRRLTASEMVYLESLSCAPVIFQRYVSGSRDIRVTVVGDVVFGTEFRIEQSECVDHRLVLGTAPCASHLLPSSLEKKILDYVRALGLEYGSIDLRLADDDSYYFFEINTAGEFLYLQDRSGQPIDAAVARHLAGGCPACSHV